MIIDAHLHVFLSASQDPERTVDHIASAERSAPVEMLEREMASAGVDRAVLAPLGPEDTYISDLLAANPNRFAGIAVAEPGQYDPAQVADRLDLGGFKGLRMFALPGEWDEAPWRGLLQRLEQDGRVL